MVKRKHMMRRNLMATIRSSLGRYIAIVAIIALGAGIFAGLRITKTDMLHTLQAFADQQGMFDLRVLGAFGWTEEDVESLSRVEGVKVAEGLLSLDALLEVEGSDSENAYRLYAISDQVNKPGLLAGRMPQRPDECLVDELYFSDSAIGKQITVAPSNSQDTKDLLESKVYTIVGLASSPLHLELDRGSTTIGNGSISAFIYLPRESFSLDYYTEIGILLDGEHQVYSQEYNDLLSMMADRIKDACVPLMQRRYEEVLAEAEKQYRDGLAEYEDGLASFLEEKEKVDKELADALAELEKAQKEFDENEALLKDGQTQLEDGKKKLQEGIEELNKSLQTLADNKQKVYGQLSSANAELLKNYKTVTSAQKQLENGRKQLEDGLEQIDDGITQIQSGISQIETGMTSLELMTSVLDRSVQALEQSLAVLDPTGNSESDAVKEMRLRLEEMKKERDSYAQQKQDLIDTKAELEKQLQDLEKQKKELQAQQKELDKQEQTLKDALDEINTGFMELQAAQAEADNQFAAAQSQLDAAKAQMDAAKEELAVNEAELKDGLAALEEGRIVLEQSWEDYRTGKQQAEEEFSKAQQELDDAKQLLDDARKDIDALHVSDAYVLDRNTNTSYVSFEGSADILAGVSTIFPAFFLSVAALVCLTTMTRMVYEERTQIGVFKALGYSGGAIMSKYLLYSGSAAIIGCLAGAILGSTIFPMIIWMAYGMLYHFSPQIILTFDWPLLVGMTLIYGLLTMLVTWWCCTRELREVPAELMRPKAPTSGKHFILEKFKVWNKISFLNKVAVRNIFRYRQRLAMMLLGIGGCTALLVTGFGLRDSVSGIATHQFTQVMTYDIGVTFSQGQSAQQQDAFRQALRGKVQQIMFVHNASVDIRNSHSAKSVTMIASDRDLTGLVNLELNGRKLAMPGEGQVLVSIGTADSMGLQVGDKVTLSTPDMDVLELTVSGIFNNHVGGYVIVHSDTILSQWRETPQQQTAYVCVNDGQDQHELATLIAEQADVVNVAVNQDLENMVTGMMDALDGVIFVVVICAALLAIIVLYNLTNINIQERLREIATIKVLGFRSGETAAYVFKENLTLSAMGMILGLGGGVFLHKLVMDQVKLDMVWFNVRIEPISFLLAAILTMVAAVSVDFFMYFKLNRINMAEALKSVE